MIRSAVVLAPDGPTSPFLPLLGLTLIERLVLTLKRCGVTRVYLADERLGPAVAGLDVEVGALAAAPKHVAGPVLVARADHVYSDELIRLATDADTSGGASRFGGLLTAPSCRLDELDGDDIDDIDVGDAFWHRIGDRASRRRAESDLLRSLIKPVDGPIARHILRRISLPVTRQLAKTSITPNQITLLATLLGVIGAILIFRATWPSLAVGGVLLFLQSLFDHNDGEISRLKFKGSELGRWLDHISDDALSTVYALAFGWSAAQLLDEPLYWRMGIGSAVAISIFHVVHYSQLALVNKSGDPFKFRWWFQTDDLYVMNDLAAGGGLSKVAQLFHACGRRDVYVFSYLIFALARVPQAAVVWYFVVAIAHAVLALVHVAAGGMRRR